MISLSHQDATHSAALSSHHAAPSEQLKTDGCRVSMKSSRNCDLGAKSFRTRSSVFCAISILHAVNRGRSSPFQRRTFSKNKGSSQQRHNCFLYGKFAFTFFQLMKLNHHIPSTISSALDLNVSGSWISSFNLSKHPREGAYGMKWLTEFHYKGLSDSWLQLSRFNMLVGFDLCQDYGHRDVCRKEHCSTLWPLYNFH